MFFLLSFSLGHFYRARWGVARWGGFFFVFFFILFATIQGSNIVQYKLEDSSTGGKSGEFLTWVGDFANGRKKVAREGGVEGRRNVYNLR